MTPSTVDRNIRAALPVIPFLQTRLPPPRWTRGPLRRAAARARLPADVARRTASADGVPCEWLIPQHSRPDQAPVYLRGDYVYCVSLQDIAMVEHLERRMDIPALIVDYRVAPGQMFLAALDDCVTACR